MTAVFFSPHNLSDDESLFAAFTLLRHRPHVAVCFRSHLQQIRRTGITAAVRERETACAMEILGCTWEQWPILDSDPHAIGLAERMHAAAERFDRCFAPAVIDDGHPQHNIVGRNALAAFGRDRTSVYHTYHKWDGRQRGALVEFEPGWPVLKLRALACYVSQIAEPSTRDWFLRDQWEYAETAA